MTTVSVVIPSYNRPEATLKAVHSALAQSYPVAEIVVVDDRSDPALDPAALTTVDPRIRVHRLDRNRGAAGARQAGIDFATGEIIAFLDSDDLWHQDKLVAQIPLVDREGYIAVSCGWTELDEDGAPTRHRRPMESDRALDFLGGCWFSPGSTVVIAKTAFERVGPLDTRLRRLEDLDWFARFALGGGALKVAPVDGATIAIGRRARFDQVEEAATRIIERFRPMLGARSAEFRQLRAWLAVELAKSASNDGRLPSTAYHLMRSFLLKPRFRLHIGGRWHAPDEPLP